MNEYFAQSLAQVLEETSTNMGNAMILDHLSKKGSVTLEEAEFYHNLCTDVITESAEDFIPDTLEVPEAPEESAPIELFDAVGNKFVFDNGNLIPVENDAPEMDAGEEMAPEMEAAPEEAPEPEMEEAPVQESEEVTEPVIEESAVIEPLEEAEVEAEVEAEAETETEVLEESDTVVARILANLKA